jgi:quercetin dioxygenase-like cupin family protein
MSDTERDQDAAELALRVLDDRSQRAAEAALDADGRAAVEDWETRLGRLACAVPPVAPSPGQLDRVLDRLRSSAAPAAGTITTRADEGIWEPMGPGVSFKIVWHDRKAGCRGMLVRMAPGSVHPAHGHDQDEECFVLEGELGFGDLPLAKGDFHFARKGHRHAAAVSVGGCLLYISGGL